MKQKSEDRLHDIPLNFGTLQYNFLMWCSFLFLLYTNYDTRKHEPIRQVHEQFFCARANQERVRVHFVIQRTFSPLPLIVSLSSSSNWYRYSAIFSTIYPRSLIDTSFVLTRERILKNLINVLMYSRGQEAQCATYCCLTLQG